MSRVLPHSLEAEKSVIGGILLHPKAFDSVRPMVSPAHFYHPAHAAIYQAMVDLSDRSKPLDEITIAEQMRADDTFGKLRAFGFDSYFAELSTAIVTVENIAFHARMVRGKATTRTLVEAMQQQVARGYEEGIDPEEYVAEVERAIIGVTGASKLGGRVGLKKILGTVIAEIERRYETPMSVTGIPWGIVQLDEATTGSQASELIILAARPSMGKTALVINACINAALERGTPSLVFSLEMSKESLVERAVAGQSRVDGRNLRSGKIGQAEWIRLGRGAGDISELRITIDDTGANSLSGIRSEARRWKAEDVKPGEIGLIVIDYLQLVQGTGKEGNREQEIAGISRGLKAMAKELRVPVIALCQLNRGPENRSDKRPNLGDLRESGQIEQDADLIAFIYRDEVYNKDTDDKGVAEIIIAKQRNGPLATVRARFEPHFTRFSNFEQRA